MIKCQVVYWRDIPVQVKVRNGRIRKSQPLSSRFQKTVYRAAYRAKAITGQAYMDAWRPIDWSVQDNTIEDVISGVVAELENAYSAERLNQLAMNKGYEPHDD